MTKYSKEFLALRAGIRAVIDLGASAYVVEGEVIERDEVLEILTEMADKETEHEHEHE